ncbi:MAG: serine hydrolase [Planctomycetota bacterium]
MNRLARLLAVLLLAVAARAQIVPDVVTYVDATSTLHQLQFNSLSGQGYRPISLNVAGGRSNPRYTAVWVRRSGAAFVGVHGVDSAGYESWRQQQVAAGYRPLLVTTAGSNADEVYAGVYVRDGVDAEEQIERSSSRMTQDIDRARSQDKVITCLSTRGGNAVQYYAYVIEPNPDEDAWCVTISSRADFTEDIAAHTEAYGRLLSAQDTPTDLRLHLWRDNSVGDWIDLHSLSAAQLQSEITNRRPSGYYPISIRGTGIGLLATFHVVFATRDLPIARTFSRTGIAVIPMDPFDQYMEEHIRAHGIRSSAIAISKDGRLVYARGYTFSEPSQALTQPTTLFRVASLSKVVTGLMTNLLIQRGGTISLGTGVNAYLGLNSSVPDFGQITVQMLLRHRSGLQNDASSWGIANLLNPGNPTLPVGFSANAPTAALLPLIYTPNSDHVYSNLGYYVLGNVVERAAGKSYERFLREDLAAPLSISRMWVSGSLKAQMRAGEAEPRNRYLDITPSEIFTDRRPSAIQFGGGGDENLARRAAAGGVLTSAVDFVRLFSGAYDLVCDGGIFTQASLDRMLSAPDPQGGANNGGFDSREVRPNGVIAYGKDGLLWGSSTQFIYRTDGVAIAVFDGYQSSLASRNSLNDIADAVTSWPTHDLFPSYGLPAYNRVCPRIYGASVDTLPNVTDDAFVLDGDVMSGVDRVSFGASSITSQASTTWSDGWFRIVSDNQIEVHPPQGFIPGAYSIVLRNGIYASRPIDVTLTRTTTRTLGATSVAFGAFDLVASRGNSTTNSDFLLCYSLSNVASPLPGIVNLDIGANFTNLWTWPSTVHINPFTSCVRWSVPDIGPAQLYFQALVIDGNSTRPLPAPVTNVRSVRSF